MELNVLKETNVEFCENMYALSMNYLRDRDNLELRRLIDDMDRIEISIKDCNDIYQMDKYINDLNVLFDRIEVIINE